MLEESRGRLRPERGMFQAEKVRLMGRFLSAVIGFWMVCGLMAESEALADLVRCSGEENVQAIAGWEGSLRATVCIVSPGKPGEELPVFRFSIEKMDHTELFSMTTSDHIVSIFPLGESKGPLIAIWSGPTG